MSFNLRRSGLIFLTATSVALSALPAQAWGDKEQGFVAGAATAIIIDQLIEGHRYRQSAPRPQAYRPAPPPQNHFVAPPRHDRHHNHRPAPAHVQQTSVHQTPAAQAFRTYTLPERRQIQRALRSSGYYSGSIDGTFGPATYTAVTAWARAQGLGANLRSTAAAFSIYDGLIF